MDTTTPMHWLVVLIVCAAFLAACAVVCRLKGRPYFWIGLCFMFPPIIAALLILPSLRTRPERSVDMPSPVAATNFRTPFNTREIKMITRLADAFENVVAICANLCVLVSIIAGVIVFMQHEPLMGIGIAVGGLLFTVLLFGVMAVFLDIRSQLVLLNNSVLALQPAQDRDG